MIKFEGSSKVKTIRHGETCESKDEYVAQAHV